MSNRTIYMPQPGWDRLQARAAEEGARQGRTVSVSEYIRRAVEAYQRPGTAPGYVVTAEDNAFAVELGEQYRAMTQGGEHGDSTGDSGPGEQGGSSVPAPEGRKHVHGTVQRPRRELLREDRTGRQGAQQDLPAGVAVGRNTASPCGNDLGPCGNASCRNRASQEHYPFCSEKCR